MAGERFENSTNEARDLALLAQLSKLEAKVEKDSMRVKGAYIVTFSFEGGAVTMRIVLHDASGADFAITNMTTLPLEKAGQGFGSEALQKLLSWARANGLRSASR